jgi:O-antigen ligase
VRLVTAIGGGGNERHWYMVLLMLLAFLSPFFILPAGDILFGLYDLLWIPMLFVIFLVRKNIHFKAELFFLFLFILILFVTTISVSGELKKLYRLIGILSPILYFSTKYIIKSEDFNRFVLLFMYGCLINIMISIFMFLTGYSLVETSQKIWLENGEVILRAGGLAGNTGMYSSIIGVTLLTALFSYFKRTINIFVFIFVLVCCLYSISIISSRAGALVCVIGLFFFLVSSGRISFINILIWVGAGVVISNFAMYLFQEDDYILASFSRFDFFSNDINSFSSGRIDNWLSIINYLDGKLVLGVGYKAGVDALGHFIDNSFLTLLVEGGIFAFLLFLSLFVFMFHNLYKYRGSVVKDERALGLSVLLMFFVTNVTSDSYTFWLTTPISLAIITLSSSYLHSKFLNNKKVVYNEGLARNI